MIDRRRSTAGRRPRVPAPLVPVLATLAVLALAPGAPAAAQGWIDPPPRVPAQDVVKLRTDVSVRVEGRVAQVEVEEWFENRGRVVGEGVYLYPLPGEAVFSNFSLYQGDQELRGETMDADEARAIYEEIVRSRRDPALIELVGHGLVRARVFPIEPGQQRKITLRYTQVLDRAGDALQFRYAASGRDPVPLSFTLVADAGAFADPFSATHELRVDRREGELRVRPEDDLRGDFSLFLPLAREQVGLTLATHRPSGEDGYFMLTLSPGEVEGSGTPRDVVAVVDVSGSMSGSKMEQTRQALHQLLGSLGAEDRFRLAAFSNRVRTSGEGWSRASGRELESAREWVDRLQAEGGTNIAGALEEAFRLESPDERLPIVVFLTDGLPTVGERSPERIAADAERERGRARVFAFGVGYDVNTYLLDRLSAAGRGSTAYVQPGEDVEVAVGALAAKITHPVLTDLELAATPVRLVELYPGELPDLFAGEELVVFGRYEGRGEGALSIRGRRTGRAETYSTTAAFPAHADGNDFIPRLWASRKLGELTRQVRLYGRDEELIEEIRRTALRYGLLSEYTAYLVREPAMVADGREDLRVMAGDAARPAAPVAATGQAAVKAAESARLRREASSAAELEVAEAEMRAAAGPGAGRRVVAGRTFERRDGVWVEASASEPDRTIAIRLYSPAYFALLEALPELRRVVTELEPVVVNGARVAVRLTDDGRSELSAADAARLAAEFRGG